MTSEPSVETEVDASFGRLADAFNVPHRPAGKGGIWVPVWFATVLRLTRDQGPHIRVLLLMHGPGEHLAVAESLLMLGADPLSALEDVLAEVRRGSTE